MGLRYIPPGKKSYKKPAVDETTTPEAVEHVIEAAQAVVAEALPVVEAAQSTVATPEETPHEEAAAVEEPVQETVEPKVVETSTTTGAKRKK